MNVNSFKLIKPTHLPPLEEGFRPAVLANHAFLSEAGKESAPLVLGLERENGKISRFETHLFPEDHPQADANYSYSERLLKFLLWQRGGQRIFVGGSPSIAAYLFTVAGRTSR